MWQTCKEMLTKCPITGTWPKRSDCCLWFSDHSPVHCEVLHIGYSDVNKLLNLRYLPIIDFHL